MWLFRTYPYIRQGTFARVQLGTDERKSWSHWLMTQWATEYTNHSLNSAVPEFCVDCVQETVTQITLIITQPVEGLLDKTENWRTFRKCPNASTSVHTVETLSFNETKGDLIARGIYYYNGAHTVPTPNKHEPLVSWDPEPPGRGSIYRPRTKTSHH